MIRLLHPSIDHVDEWLYFVISVNMLDKNAVVGVIAVSSAFPFQLDQQSTLIEER
jgi:hypothetical protein